MFENIDWSLVFVGLGALFAALLAIVEGYQAYNKYVVPKKEKKRISEKIELEKKLEDYENSRGGLERSLENYVMTNNFTAGFHSYPSGLSSDFEKRMKEWNEIYDRCLDWRTASMSVITVLLQELSQIYLPKTCKEFDLVGQLNVDYLTHRYLNGEQVAKRWIEETYPTHYEALMENLKDKESKLGSFFLNLNKSFLENKVLNRFRRGKKELNELGQHIIKDLKIEEEKLQKELELYKDIEIAEERLDFESPS